jgi:hypothetical protein
VSRAKSGRPKPPGPDRFAAFLNIPYDNEFLELYLAYIAGLTAFGLTPHATLELPGGARRLDRILELIAACHYSFHDLSRIELNQRRPATPRFNMPFELGLTVAWDRAHPNRHTWFVLESKSRRVLKSLSDLAGTDVYIHDGKPHGVFRELGNALVRSQKQATVKSMMLIYDGLRERMPDIVKQAGAKSPFEARVFKDLVVAASVVPRYPLL